ncbi:hypothetical protein QVD17_07415 [Tagetes erecta]|uniref:Uncharacterized protein n=1 Tax=Tagetes erecta TaxID=13708 RepID=A0AAD8LLY5_TARER|nr:hypothetical protein QVD17_07415 [Tagetes erecta]
MTNVTSWSNSSLMLNREQMNWSSYDAMHDITPPILDTSWSYFPVLESSNFNSIASSDDLTHWSTSSPKKGEYESIDVKLSGNDAPNDTIFTSDQSTVTFKHSTEAPFRRSERRYENVDERRNFIEDATNLGVMNSSNSDFVPNLDAFSQGCSTEMHTCNNLEMGSSGCVQNPNGIGEDELTLDDVDIAYLLSYVYDNNQPSNLNHPNQDLKAQNFSNNDSFCSNDNEEPTSVNRNENLDGYDLHCFESFDPTFKAMDEQFMEPIWSYEDVAYDVTYQGQTLKSYIQA